MAYPKKPDDRATYWLRKIEHAETCMGPFMEAGDRIAQMYENRATTSREEALEDSDAGGENISRVKPSVVFYWIDQSIANQLFRDPTFRVKPKTKESVEGSRVVGKMVNHWFRETRQKEQDKRVLLDAYCYPFGVKKFGWMEDEDGEEETTLSDLTDKVLDDPEDENLFLATGEPTVVTEDQNHVEHLDAHMPLLTDETIDEDIREGIIQAHIDEHKAILNGVEFEDVHEDVKDDQPWGVRWHPRDFRIDPMATDGLKDARWVAFRSVRTLDEVRANPNYKNTANLQPTSRLEKAPEARAWTDGSDDDDFGVVVLWEVWARRFPTSAHKRKNLLVVIAEQQGEGGTNGLILRHDEAWPYSRLRSYPCSLLAFHKSPVQGWVSRPMLEMAGADNIQALINEILDSNMAVMRKQKNVHFYDTDIFSENEIEMAIRAPKDAAIGVRGLSKAQGDPIRPMPYVKNTQEKADFPMQALNLFNLVAGTPGPGMGSEDETATEAAINERRTTSREALRSSEFETYQIETADAFWRLATQFKPENQILIDESADEWAALPEDIVTGSYAFEIDVASHATALAVERKQWMDLLNLFAGIAPGAAQLGMPPPNLPWLAEQVLVRGYEVPNPEEVWPAIGGNAPMAPPMPQGMPATGPQMPAGGGNGTALPEMGPALPGQFSAPVPSTAGIMANAGGM